ncbi:MAG: SUMF1/EgtB/PvdO family nonheme iron enzyme [Polyangiaceae bacterium]|nr:SUMF1/EgtB/PvdO family nonheme iron enzyme [Polyangiaceae bacterium]
MPAAPRRPASPVAALLPALAVIAAACAPGADPARAAPATSAAEPAPSTAASSPSPPPAAESGAGEADAGDAGAGDPGAGDAAADAAADGGAPEPCPAEMALAGRFCVDRWEAHLVTEAGGALVPHPHHERPASGVRYLARSAPGVFPQAYISRVEAKAACEASGKRLCTLREWQRACRGKGTQRYPYGPRGERGRCNTGKIHLLRELFGEHPPGGLRYDEHFNSPELARKPGFLARTGEYSRCESDLGVFDMLGNLHEWVSGTVDQDLMDRLAEEPVERRRQPWREGNGIFMGGFFSTTDEHGPGCHFITVAHEPAYHDYSTGFRCCAAAALPAEPPERSKKKKRR